VKIHLPDELLGAIRIKKKNVTFAKICIYNKDSPSNIPLYANYVINVFRALKS